MNKTAHTSQLLNQVRNFSNNCDEFLDEYYLLFDQFSTYKARETRLNKHRSFDEMNAFINYNANSIIHQNPLISIDTLTEILYYLSDIYLNDDLYDKLKQGVDIAEDVKGLEAVWGKSLIVIFSIKKCLQKIDTLDYEGKDALKRVLYKENIKNDKEYIKLLDKHTNSPMSYTSPEDLLEYFYTIVEDCVYPHYHFIDEDDIREIIFQLSFELSHNTGFFSHVRKCSIIRGRVNKKRCFSLLNNYNDKSSVIKVSLKNQNAKTAYKCIFLDDDLSLFESNFRESQIDLEEALDHHFQYYSIYKINRPQIRNTLPKITVFTQSISNNRKGF